ncbi:sugar ABC transporter substrate-binding protein [Curvibacter sp. CHRR-16]|uniref:ABC transporter substrate-binding protein n=1 Tax=Curvibacter sp. CHRR-16 TaxID=2835872 RepID=UPI001BD96D50|nr:sugar ABC transporter substrate-binding protein [Curvibacter sp. CHRR-16]MBT0570309.1 sugar ABC transporter substrate-binding protein [Curvibacter sp. CHRR-16]
MNFAKRTTLSTMIGLALSASGLMASHAAQAGEVTIWAWDPNFNIAIMQEAAKRYQAKHPGVTFKIVDMAKADVEQKLQTGLASGVSKALPDIVLVEDYNAPKYLRSFPGAFEALNGKINHDGFAKYKVNLMTMNGKVYGVPFDTGTTGMYYRSDLLKQAGFAAKDMENITWDRFIDIGKQVEAKTGKKMLAMDPGDIGLLRVMMQGAGRWYFDKDGKLDIKNNPALKAALQTYAKIMQAGIYKPASGWGDWVGAFNKGDAASVTTGVWITGSVKAEASQSGKWAVAPTPRLNVPGAINASNLGGSSWYVLSSAKEKAAAIDFLNEVYVKDMDFYQNILTTRGAVGSLLASRNGKAYSEADPFFGGDKVWQKFSDWLSKVPAVNYGMYTYEVDTAVSAQLPALAQGLPVEKALDAIQNQVASQIPQ